MNLMPFDMPRLKSQTKKDRPRRKNILITCAGGPSSLYLARRLRARYNIFLVDGSDQPLAHSLGLPFNIIPFGSSPGYSTTMADLIRRWRIDCIVPGADEELAPTYRLCKKLGTVTAVTPRLQFINLCLNKKLLMAELETAGLSHLPGFSSQKKVIYPAVAKPVYGRGSRQMHILRAPSELAGYLKLYNKRYDEVLVQPYIEGQEYTVSVIVNDQNLLLGVVPKLVILKRGITRSAVAERHRGIEKLAEKIVERYRPSGPFNIQLMTKGKKIFIFEINPRLSTTSVLTEAAFGNEVELFLRHAGQTTRPSLPKFKSGIYMYRHDEHSFWDGKRWRDG